MRSEIKRLKTIEEGTAFCGFTMTRYHSLLTEFIGDARVVALGLYCDGKPAGLLLAAIESVHCASIVSIYVQKHVRRTGYAKQLVGIAEQIVCEAGIEALLLGVRPDADSQPIVSLLNKCDWSQNPKHLRTLMGVFRRGTTLNDATWMKRTFRNPRLEIFPWTEITQSEIDSLAAAYSGPDCWFPQSLSPLIDNRDLHKASSFGLRFDGEIVGWAITHRREIGPIIISSLFAKNVPEYAMAGLALLHKMSHALIACGNVEPTPVSCAIVEGNKFFDFLERQLFPHIELERSELLVYRKELNPTVVVSRRDFERTNLGI